MKKYIIFDLDGTLINTYNTLSDKLYKALEEYKPEYLEKLKSKEHACNGM
jgi:hydroxymethylpyrimidine pyrophosphatase-like HAD family hydrolase